jgi:hypothetical protein
MIDTSKRVGSVWPDPPKLQPYKYGRRSEGRFTSVKYSSLSLSEIEAMALAADARGYNYEVEVGFGNKADISIDYNFNSITSSGVPVETEEVEDVWELNFAQTTKSLLDSRNPLALASDAEDLAQCNLLRNWVKQGVLIDKLSSTTDKGNFTPPLLASGTPFGSNGIVLAKFLWDGVEQVEISVPILTHTKVVSAFYSRPLAFTNVGRIYSTATLISAESIPTTALFGFPSDTDPGPTLIPNTAPALYQSYLYGWKKNAPSCRQIANRKWQLTQTFDYGLWAMQLYNSVRL